MRRARAIERGSVWSSVILETPWELTSRLSGLAEAADDESDYTVLTSDAKLRDAVYAQGQFLVTWGMRK